MIHKRSSNSNSNDDDESESEFDEHKSVHHMTGVNRQKRSGSIKSIQKDGGQKFTELSEIQKKKGLVVKEKHPPRVNSYMDEDQALKIPRQLEGIFTKLNTI
jgi:16S rRNA U1498 N3-methylase RsmE